MASFCPTPLALQANPVLAGKMNAVSKIVFSRTLDKAEWNNTRLTKDNITEEISKLK